MGEHKINTTRDENTRLKFIRHLLDDLSALEKMLQDDKIESGIIRIGAEQEFCIVNKIWRPDANAATLIQTINDPHFTTELARYNLEINLDPIELTTDAFSRLENQLNTLLEKAKKAATTQNSKIVLSGILPSICEYELGIDFMTPDPRYYALNEILREQKGTDFRMHLSGVDELSIMHDSIMFEACNNSFQMHLQIEPDDFCSSYNWAQAIAGPVLGLCVNSPLLFGRELWNETRIALFQQSIDTREVSYTLKDLPARVTFGDSWGKGSIADFYKNEISRYKIVLSKDIQKNALEELSNGGVPKLKALNLHNGTIYRWNRPCYGVSNGKAHIRIENRYIPSGPTVIDEMANFAFWVGLMVGRPAEFDNLEVKMDFKDVKSNFIKAARTGSESQMRWMDKEIVLKELVLNTLLPIAYTGLKLMKINAEDIKRLLGIIEQRAKGQTAAQWTIKCYRKLRKEMKLNDAMLVLTKSIYNNQKNNIPVHKWSDQNISTIIRGATDKVGHIMSTQLLTAYGEEMAELTIRVMEWNNIHHMPIVDHNEKLIGLLTWTHIERFKEKGEIDHNTLKVADIMVKSLTTVEPSTTIQEAITLMKKNDYGCLPVLKNEQLVGIITTRDLIKFDIG